MARRISFSDNVSILNQKGHIEIGHISDKISRVRKKLGKTQVVPKMYNETQARCVAERIENELKHPILLENRVRNERIIEHLLIYHKIYSKINKVYRLSNNTLIILRKRLVGH